MSVRVDPTVVEEFRDFGGSTASRCFNCGNCTAVCGLSGQGANFPRRFIRYIQLGLAERMHESLDPWLCYYCGDCSDSCPREAEPGNLMMASRRWLTSRYDWTGVSRLMYRRPAAELAALGIVALVVLLLFVVPPDFGFRLLARHPEARAAVNLAAFAPAHIVHVGDAILALLLGGLLAGNAVRMVAFAMRNTAAGPWAYAAELKTLALHAFTQRRWRDCSTNATRQWLRHFALVMAYGSMFALVVVFLPWFQVEDTSFHWTSLIGYYATLVLLGATLWIARERLQKRDQIHKHTDLSDWLFLGLLFLTSLTGILLHLARLLNLAMPTYLLYMVHLMIAVPMLVVEVPFSKWSHLLYRPLAMFLLAVQTHAAARRTAPDAAPAVQT
jgi:quinone-modifying oxidoreductase, subunit QmoC